MAYHNNCLVSATVALQKIMAALRLVKGQREMAKPAAPVEANRFMRGAHLILQMVKQTTLYQTPTPPPGDPVVAGTPVAVGENNQRFESVVAGWEYLKLAWDLLNDSRRRYKTKFCKNSTENHINLFRQQCYNMLNTMEANCASLGIKKKSWW